MHFLPTLVGLLALTLPSWGQTCDPATCKPPDCRCWNDPSIPGGLAAADTPQMILISFEYAINPTNVDVYTNLFTREF